MIVELGEAIAYCGVFLATLLVIELMVRQDKLPSYLSRRLAHVGAGLFSLIMWATFSPLIFLICTSLLVGVITISHAKRLLRSVHNVSRRTQGEIYLPVGIFVTYLIAHNQAEIFVPAILIMTFADVVSGMISDWRSKGRASKWGSVGFLFTAFLLLLLFEQNLAMVASISLILMVVERISPYGSDNFTIPIAASVLLLL